MDTNTTPTNQDAVSAYDKYAAFDEPVMFPGASKPLEKNTLIQTTCMDLDEAKTYFSNVDDGLAMAVAETASIKVLDVNATTVLVEADNQILGIPYVTRDENSAIETFLRFFKTSTSALRGLTADLVKEVITCHMTSGKSVQENIMFIYDSRPESMQSGVFGNISVNFKPVYFCNGSNNKVEPLPINHLPMFGKFFGHLARLAKAELPDYKFEVISILDELRKFRVPRFARIRFSNKTNPLVHLVSLDDQEKYSLCLDVLVDPNCGDFFVITPSLFREASEASFQIAIPLDQINEFLETVSLPEDRKDMLRSLLNGEGYRIQTSGGNLGLFEGVIRALVETTITGVPLFAKYLTNLKNREFYGLNDGWKKFASNFRDSAKEFKVPTITQDIVLQECIQSLLLGGTSSVKNPLDVLHLLTFVSQAENPIVRLSLESKALAFTESLTDPMILMDRDKVLNKVSDLMSESKQGAQDGNPDGAVVNASPVSATVSNEPVVITESPVISSDTSESSATVVGPIV